MVMFLVPKDLDLVKKSLECLDSLETDCGLYVLLCFNNMMLCVVCVMFRQFQDGLPDCILAHVS